MNKKAFLLAALVLVSVAFLFASILPVLGQASGTQIVSLSPESGVAGSPFNVTLQGTIQTLDGNFSIVLVDSNGNPVLMLDNAGNTVPVQLSGNATGNNVSDTLPVPALIPGKYAILLQDLTNSSAITSDSRDFHIAAAGIAAIPIATGLIMLVAVGISLANMGLNRALITKMIGWHEYRSMQKEIAEYNSERMAALRAKDTKTLERLKKKESQINSMQTKMFKPQMILLPITFIYLIVWPVLTGFFPFTVAYIPGLGAQPFFAWYMICSFFFGTLASRIIGVTPIQ